MSNVTEHRTCLSFSSSLPHETHETSKACFGPSIKSHSSSQARALVYCANPVSHVPAAPHIIKPESQPRKRFIP